MRNERAYFCQGHLVIVNGVGRASCSCGERCWYLLEVTADPTPQTDTDGG